MKTVATIEARMTSTRLPGKVLLPAAGKPLLEHMIERVRRVPEIDQIVVATTVNATDQPIADLARRLGVGCFRGSEADVLGRVLRAAQAYRADTIVELTGDCPLIDQGVIAATIRRFLQGGADYVSNTLPRRTYPDGMDTQVFPTSVLAEVAQLTQDPGDREHVSLYIYRHPDRYRCAGISSDLPERWQGVRLTLDTPEDYQLIKAIFEALYPADPHFSLGDVLQFLDAQPALQDLHRHAMERLART